MQRAFVALLMATAAVLASAVAPAALAESSPTATMGAWSPNSPAIKVGTVITFKATGSDDSGVQGFEWDFDGDEELDAYTPASRPGSKSASASIKHTYDSPASLFPAVRAINTGMFVSPWDTYDSAGRPVQLVIGDSAPPQVTMSQWAPYAAKGVDGAPGVKFAFSADASSTVGIARFEWDFDGNGVADKTTPASGNSARASAEHIYGIAGSWVPKVRAVDANGLPSPWVGYPAGKGSASLETASPKLSVALEFSPAGSKELPTAFTFKVTSSNKPEKFEWDFDGDGKVDATTTAPTARHTFTRNGLYLPSVTVSDAFGMKTTAVPAGDGTPLYIRLLPAGPSAKMEQWSPYLPAGADGDPGTLFTFSASTSAKGGVEKAEWDFNGDGKADADTLVSGIPASARVTATFSYSRPGNYTPQVRAVDGYGQASPWAFFSAGPQPAKLDVAGKASPETYCDGMTIEQLIASGQYNVVDNRVGQKRALLGTAGDDLMIAGARGVLMRGIGGNDCMIGGPSNDMILGGSGDDQMFGAGGNDRIEGNGGRNKIDGGSGKDRCSAGAVNCES